MKKVFVAMSGGVDSTIASYILKKRGFDVYGVTMVHKGDDLDNISVEKAKHVAKIIGIKHFVIDLKKEFKQYVLDYVLEMYKNGFTPNPCIMCNKFIKFGFLFDCVLNKYKADFFATGHYAKIIYKNNKHYLQKAFDQKKDQTYFLYRLNQEKLSYILFPHENSTKEGNIKIAHSLGFSFYKDKSGSQDVCFIENNDIHKFLQDRFGIIKGNIIIDDDKNTVVGIHDGFYNFTIGQRKMLKNIKVPTNSGPYFVSKIDAKTNTVFVTNDQSKLYKDKLIVDNLHLITDDTIDKDKKYIVKYRSGGKYVDAFINSLNKKYIYNFCESQRAITKGQHIVIYDNDIVVGGSII